VFCRIVQGDLQAHRVFESDVSLAFLDHRPLFAGHCLLIPKTHYDAFNDVPASLIGPLFTHAHVLARAMETGLAADGAFVALNNKVSQSVPHVHIHIVPRRHRDGLKGFFWPRHRYENEEAMATVTGDLRRAIERLLEGSP
jgi:histidine triad (HIT) family protein